MLSFPADRLSSPYRDEAALVASWREDLSARLDWSAVVRRARPWIEAVRHSPPPIWAMERLLQAFPISSSEGLALMRLAESLLRIADQETAILLTADQLTQGQFRKNPTNTALSQHTASLIALSQKFLPPPEYHQVQGLWQKMGGKTVLSAALMAVELLGKQFVLGESIEAALKLSHQGAVCSFDMLGEGARSDADALLYTENYANAIAKVGQAMNAPGSRWAARPVAQRHGISIKLSALHPRYEWSQWQQVQDTLIPRFWQLCQAAAEANIHLTMDAEEVERLELSLHVFANMVERVAKVYPNWQGLGLAIQAYQPRALEVIDEVARLAKAHQRMMMCRLVKGAYWDREIKRAQELGLPHYPVWTQKAHTDTAYLLCAARLIDHAPLLYPQFASHNATTLSSVLCMIEKKPIPFELQRLHGMGDGVHQAIMQSEGCTSRIYAPVGAHRDLLAYLVRRLLENGANASFVHKINDPAVPIDALLISPLDAMTAHSPLPAPANIFNARRVNSQGMDVAQSATRDALIAAKTPIRLTPITDTPSEQLPAMMAAAQQGYEIWQSLAVATRAEMLQSVAERMQNNLTQLSALLVMEAHKTWHDAIAEVREAIDFLRYYAFEAQTLMAPLALIGPTGETNQLRLYGRGVWVAISPWNFPLAIFTGQIAAALVTGNAVMAKPAEQTPHIAKTVIDYFHAAGVPKAVLQGAYGLGETVGAGLIAQPQVAGVVFTGSTAVAKLINRSLANRDGAIVPLIAETGGINAMLVDASALVEQVCDAVIQSAFHSAGQRCSALRLLCVHESIADRVFQMIAEAVAVLQVGDPANFATDVGPVIDEEALQTIERQITELRAKAKQHFGHAPYRHEGLAFVPPMAFEIDRIQDIQQEIFAPVLHLYRWSGDPRAVVQAVNQLGYGLTFGIHTRLDARAEHLAEACRVGNVYVNRNMIGAQVGIQPFGGEGLSGTGPKAGGPHYLIRFCREQTLTINTTAAGGNATLLAQLA